MNDFKERYTKDFLKDLKKIKSDFSLQERLKSKIQEILKNPYHYKSLRNVLKNRRRTHISSFVLIFEVIDSEGVVAFHVFKHHDEVY
ncbi:type II toxin-antitoxin system RelE family toxin [Desulfamplus magnetovallimortis]|uniref:type II toxin-antitoxin system RelE family toxin n=1 Tax=Desulfamplus magnetovallimortis TaxID=1246637 RepID=UPI001C97F9A7|nr:type II toxin-antitoxin system RelE/ParE family toxin [Desulfamplus magnetovallimortis]